MKLRTELLRFLSWIVPFFGVSAAIGGSLGGTDSILRGSIAFGICVPLALLSLQASLWSLSRSTTWQLGVILGGPIVCAAITLTAGLLLNRFVTVCRHWDFWLWIALGYLSTLLAKVTLIYVALPNAAATTGTTMEPQ